MRRNTIPAARARRIRKKTGMTQAAMAVFFGNSRDAIAKWEAGVNPVQHWAIPIFLQIEKKGKTVLTAVRV